MALWKHHTVRYLGDETIRLPEGDFRAAKLECVPKKDWNPDGGKVLVWIDRDRAIQLRHEYYDPRGKLERTLVMTDLKTVGVHTIATRLRVELPGQPRNYTQIEYKGLRFDQPIADEVFTPEFLRKRLDSGSPALPPP
jgi:hypothetical protein